MVLTDEIILHLCAGKGGDGVVAWYKNRRNRKGGPAGGDGGKGGDVFLRGVRQIDVLSKYMGNNTLKAQDGQNGGKRSLEGKNGSDLFIDVPVGSVISNLNSGEVYEITRENEQVKILSGGKGGFGNEHFKSSRNVTPMEFTYGKPGQCADFKVELRLIANAGLIGLPNAGKSSLLNALTRSNAKVGNYAFTTLNPNLGVMGRFVLADIPGLIKGASEGRGIGHKFLRHVMRTNILIHCISGERDDVVSTYNLVRKELEKYDVSLSRKPEIVVLTKIDLLSKDEMHAKIAALKNINSQIAYVSIFDDELMNKLKIFLCKELESF